MILGSGPLWQGITVLSSFTNYFKSLYFGCLGYDRNFLGRPEWAATGRTVMDITKPINRVNIIPPDLNKGLSISSSNYLSSFHNPTARTRIIDTIPDNIMLTYYARTGNQHRRSILNMYLHFIGVFAVAFISYC